jgi:hypothetical protein
MVVLDAQKRISDLNIDPVGEYRKKAAEAAAKAADEAAMNDPNLAAKKAAMEKKKQEMMRREAALKDSLAVTGPLTVTDSLTVVDSLTVSDSLAVEPVDSTRIGFLEANRNVKVYKKNMQVACDSLLFTDLDSLVRMYRDPVIWQETTRQYQADSISLIVKDGTMEKASLMSNAFVILQQDTTHYNQIKGTEMLAFFGDKGTLRRFDVLGGASALFYVEENGTLATVNKTDSKMLSATFKDGEIEKIYYYDQPKNDGYPKVQMAKEDRSLKGFNWQPERRPADRYAVTPLSLRPSQRLAYSARPKARFRQTDIYFPGYISDINRQIQVRDSLRKVRELESKLAKKEALKDTVALTDSLSVKDSLLNSQENSISLQDSLKVDEGTKAVADTSALDAPSQDLTPEQQKAALKAEKAKKRQEAKALRVQAKKKRQEEKEKRWAELDKRDEEKAKAKEEKRKEKERNRKRKALEAAAREAEKDAQLLQQYIEKYRKQKEKKHNP